MKKILSTLTSLTFLTATALAQLTEFSQGDILSAGTMNQNFKYLENRFGGLNEKTVDCGTSGSGSGINAAIEKGYNSIIVKGICKENIVWDLDKGERGFLKLRGYNDDQTQDKIVDNSSNALNVIRMIGSSTLIIDNLTISGGSTALLIAANSFVDADNITLDSYTEMGIEVVAASVANLGSITLDGTKQSSFDEGGIFVNHASAGYIYGTTTIKGNSKSSGGIGAGSGSSVWLSGNVSLDNNQQSLVIQDGAFMGISSSATITITNSTNYGIKAYLGTFTNYGKLNITGGIVRIDRSSGIIENMTLTGGTGTSTLLYVNDSPGFNLQDSTIKNHAGTLFYAKRSNVTFHETNTIKNESSSSGCVVDIRDSNLDIYGTTTIDGNNNNSCNALNIDRSSGRIENLTVSSTEENALKATASQLIIDGGTYSSTNDEGVNLVEGSSVRIYSHKSALSITSVSNQALEIRRNSFVKLDKGGNDFTINSSDTSRSDIIVLGASDLLIQDHTHSHVEVIEGSFIQLYEDVTVSKLSCDSKSIVINEGTVTDASACTQLE